MLELKIHVRSLNIISNFQWLTITACVYCDGLQKRCFNNDDKS